MLIFAVTCTIKSIYKVTFILELFEDAFACLGFCLPEMAVDSTESDNNLPTLLFRCFMLSQNSTFLHSYIFYVEVQSCVAL